MSINTINNQNCRPILPCRQNANWGLRPNINMPNINRNYCLFDQNKVDYFVKQKENALPYLTDILEHSNNEAQVTETLYIMDRMIDNGTKGIDKLYPVFSRFNQTQSPNIQTFLAGIYRKIQVPDAFGPLCKMLIQNSLKPNSPNQTFDPNEEIGGAILSYLSDRWRG
ncbi:hypothetical protein J6N69_04015 [bacterium]|nr:hypothetical protein [bacterium]MBP3846390.1 hypothetical protein [bacterium]